MMNKSIGRMNRRLEVATLILTNTQYDLDLSDLVDRSVLADKLDDEGRENEAILLRSGNPVHLENGHVRPADASAVARAFEALVIFNEDEAHELAQECEDFAGELEYVIHEQGEAAAIAHLEHHQYPPRYITLRGKEPRDWIIQLNRRAAEWSEAINYLQEFGFEAVDAVREVCRVAVQKAQESDWNAALAAAERAWAIVSAEDDYTLWRGILDEIRRQMGKE
jgi:hypothetical protein